MQVREAPKPAKCQDNRQFANCLGWVSTFSHCSKTPHSVNHHSDAHFASRLVARSTILVGDLVVVSRQIHGKRQRNSHCVQEPGLKVGQGLDDIGAVRST